tara:strand:+ start:84897 stop:85649 length:753 start_codon:yes stop_codon:yes gene_type:complete
MLYGQEYLTDVSVTSGAKFNSSVTNEKFSDFFGEDRYERNVYHTSSWNCKPFVAIQTSLIELELKKQKKGRSLSLKLEAGLLYNQVYRDHHFGFLYIQPVDADTTLYHIYDSDYPLDYSTRSNNLGFRLGVIFIKKWSRIFDFEYGLTYRINYAFLNRTTYHHLPSNESWRELKYPKSMYRKSLINQEVHYYLGAIFKLNKRLSIGLSTEVPSLMFGYLKYRNQYPIPGEVNNFMNRNLFLGLKCAYRLK